MKFELQVEPGMITDQVQALLGLERGTAGRFCVNAGCDGEF